MKEEIRKIQEQLSKIQNDPNMTIMCCSFCFKDDTKSWKETCAECPSVKEIISRGDTVTTQGGTFKGVK